MYTVPEPEPQTVLLSRRRRRRATFWFWVSLLVMATVGGVAINQSVGRAWPQLIGLGALSIWVLAVITWLDASLAISESWARRRREARQLAALRAETEAHLASIEHQHEVDDHEDRQHTIAQAQAARLKSQMKRGV